MNEIIYSNIVDLVKNLYFPQQSETKDSITKLGALISNDDEDLKFMYRIVSNRLAKPDKNISLKNEEERINIEKILIAKLTEIQKFNLFVILYNFQFNCKSFEIFNGCKDQIRRLIKVLDISTKELSQITNFYLAENPFTDFTNSIYFVSEKKNKLISATGVNIQYSLKKENEVVYLKYFKNRSVFLSKTFNCHRPNNSITENIQVKEINILNDTNYFKIGCGILAFEDLKKSIIKHHPFQSIKVNATESTPKITLDTTLSRIEIKGSSSPLSPINYFEPINVWLNNYEIYGGESLDIHLQFNYFNSYTSKCILNFVTKCKSLLEKQKLINITWYYQGDDEEILEFGEYLLSVFGNKLQLKLIEGATKIQA